MKKTILAVTSLLFALGLNLAYADYYESSRKSMRENAGEIKSMCEEMQKSISDKAMSAEEKKMMNSVISPSIKAMYISIYYIKHKKTSKGKDSLKEIETFNYPTQDPLKLCWKTYDLAKSL